MISLFELFKIGIGPSSSHTVGPMKAAYRFAQGLAASGLRHQTHGVRVELFGSLAWTGHGHSTDKAVILGLAGEQPASVDPDLADHLMAEVRDHRELWLHGGLPIRFSLESDILFDTLSPAPVHPNTMAFTAFDGQAGVLKREVWYSVGGGFVMREGDDAAGDGPEIAYPYRYRNAAELLALGREKQISIAHITRANDAAVHRVAAVDAHVDLVIDAMMRCIDRGMAMDGMLPGSLHVKRRAKSIHDRLQADRLKNVHSAHEIMDHVSLYAIAVNEENAAGSRVVTAPTNGAAGVLPAVLRYYRDHCDGSTIEQMRVFLLTANAIGGLFKMNASISGAEVGCQGEVGVACSMAAAGLTAALGGSNEQIENAAEIGMEHHLGLTCDPVGGLVQIPCIERNAFGAVKAINAASLALHGDGSHKISLDHVIATMRQTGADMSSKYKETSLGGLAVNFVEC